MYTLTPLEQSLILALDKAVETRGADYTYTKPEGASCQYNTYSDDGTITGPGCIIGFACHEAGVLSPESLADHEGNGVEELALDISNQVLRALASGQSLQDSGTPWGEARDEAIAVLVEEGCNLSFRS